MGPGAAPVLVVHGSNVESLRYQADVVVRAWGFPVMTSAARSATFQKSTTVLLIQLVITIH